MGRDKASLPWKGRPLLTATVERLRPLFRQVIIVSKPEVALPPLNTTVVYDATPIRGPLAGLAAGLAASDAPYCFVLGCDMPFVDPLAVAMMAEQLEGCRALALSQGGHTQPLHAFYQDECLPLARRLLAQGKTSLMALLDQCQARVIPVDALPEAKLFQGSLADLDTPQQYQDALEAVRM